MKNFVKRGEVIDYVNTSGSDINSGDLVIIGALIGFAQTDIASGATGAVLLKGVFTVAKANMAFTQGAKLYWDNTAKNATTTTTSNTLFAVAHTAALAGDLTAEIQLTNAI